MNALGNWCNEKCHKQPTINLKINNNPTVQTQDAKYLGMLLD
jgi:hypothetical protein